MRTSSWFGFEFRRCAATVLLCASYAVSSWQQLCVTKFILKSWQHTQRAEREVGRYGLTRGTAFIGTYIGYWISFISAAGCCKPKKKNTAQQPQAEQRKGEPAEVPTYLGTYLHFYSIRKVMNLTVPTYLGR